ncbi:MAG: hypothetical protein ABWY00_08300, partial [Dongiaceae bacterium]
MTSWEILASELRDWQTAGHKVELWWRDDDAVADTPALRQLLEIARVPLALAVIPGRLDTSLAPLLQGRDDVKILQHGWRHQNHEPAGSKKSELGESRDLAALGAELGDGRRILQTAFGTQALPVLTPPWNRIGGRAVAILQSIGFIGLTRYLPRTAPQVHGVNQVNTHVDVIDWRGKNGPPGGFLGEDACLSLFIGHLQARRLGQV